MWKIGLTGSIGSGKSTVASLFQHMGIPVYNADNEAKRFYQYPYVIKKLNNYFGSRIIDGEGKVDKSILAAEVFSDKEKLKWINHLIHPMVKEDFACWCDLHHGFPFVIHEAAILFESGFDKYFDRVILVTAPQSLRLERVIQRDSLESDLIKQRMASQWEDERKANLADFIVVNDGKQLLLPAVEAVHQTLLKLV